MPMPASLLQTIKLIENPSQTELRELALKHTPNILKTDFGGMNKVSSRNKNRVAKRTYIIASEDKAKTYAGQTIDPARAKQLIDAQSAYIAEKGELIQIDGYLGIGPRAVGVRWLYSVEGANIAAMQQVLAFSRQAVEGDLAQKRPFEPSFSIVYTPGCKAEGMPGEQAVLVDMEKYVTYVIGPDYFGESKKGALRMLNDLNYQRGGLVLHAGAKVVSVGGRQMTFAVMGESGTGKTTTSFARHGEDTQPLQDDMVTIWPGGEISVTENGCFAKTHDLTPESEPIIYNGSTRSEAWLENVYQDAQGKVNFSKGVLSAEEVKALREEFIATGFNQQHIDDYIAGKVKSSEVVDELGMAKDGWDFIVWTQNGRVIFPMSVVPNAADPLALPKVESLGILNRDEGADAAVPGIIHFVSPEQAAGYFMLGETSKTSAAGKDRGRMRSPFTQPFFPRPVGLQAGRFNELVATMPGVKLWMMNTGYVGGDQTDVDNGKALKVKIRHSTAMLNALLRGTAKWTVDPDFGYEVIDVNAPENAELLKEVPAEILQPRIFFEKNNRLDEYKTWVTTMKKERLEFLQKNNVNPEIIAAVTGK
jgi:phosphoenolpyruvate carboxykinase (ATP)